MPHLFVNRPRLHNLTSSSDDLKAQFRWETINAVVYKLGGGIFIAGSILFFPRFQSYENLGVWLFFFGSLLYLLVTSHDLAEAIRYFRVPNTHSISATFELIAALSYLFGTVLFTVGSIFFLSSVGWTRGGASLFVIGSLLFVLGAGTNILQIVKARSVVTLQLMNLTAVSFLVGSVLFAVASVPYLWRIVPDERSLIYGFLAWQYLIGSVLFLAGGIFNYWRAFIVINEEMAQAP